MAREVRPTMDFVKKTSGVNRSKLSAELIMKSKEEAFHVEGTTLSVKTFSQILTQLLLSYFLPSQFITRYPMKNRIEKRKP